MQDARARLELARALLALLVLRCAQLDEPLFNLVGTVKRALQSEQPCLHRCALLTHGGAQRGEARVRKLLVALQPRAHVRLCAHVHGDGLQLILQAVKHNLETAHTRGGDALLVGLGEDGRVGHVECRRPPLHLELECAPPAARRVQLREQRLNVRAQRVAHLGERWASGARAARGRIGGRARRTQRARFRQPHVLLAAVRAGPRAQLARVRPAELPHVARKDEPVELLLEREHLEPQRNEQLRGFAFRLGRRMRIRRARCAREAAALRRRR